MWMIATNTLKAIVGFKIPSQMQTYLITLR